MNFAMMLLSLYDRNQTRFRVDSVISIGFSFFAVCPRLDFEKIEVRETTSARGLSLNYSFLTLFLAST